VDVAADDAGADPLVAFNPRDQERLASNKFDPIELVCSAMNNRPPWDSIIDFATHTSYCGFEIFPRQGTLLKLIFLETENMTQYDIDVINEWRQNFATGRDVFGVQPDIWERVEYLKARGYRRFPWIQMVIGRRGSKGAIGGLLGAEQLAYLHTLDSPQTVFELPSDKDVYMNIGATNQTTAARQLFADVRSMVERCGYFKPKGAPPWTAELKDNIMRIRTPADLRRIAQMKADKQPIDHQIASLIVVALGASSVSGRGSTSFCLDPETPVLTADLQWVPIKSVMPGDAVVGIDEYPTRVEGGDKNGQRKLRRATVLAKATTVKKAYRLTFDDGRSVVCSGDHRWLIRRSTGEFRWRPVKGKSSLQDIKVGDDVVQVVEPWAVDDSRDAGYLAGVYDGEGSLGGKISGSSGLSITFTQNPGLVLEKTMRLMKEKGFNPQPQNSNAYLIEMEKRCQQWAIRGVSECLRFLGQVRPDRLVARAHLAYEGVSLRGKASSRYVQQTHYRRIVRIEELAEQTLIDIQTSTGTFVANGFVSHNCNMYDEFAFHVQTGSVKSDAEIYHAWQPNLGQFAKEALTYIPSSPWTKAGQFYVLYQQAAMLMQSYKDETGTGDEARQNLINVGQTVELDADPTRLIFQGPSWALYEDWERTQEILGLGYAFGKPPEPDLTDERQQREQRMNPDTFRVEKLGQFREVMDQYLDGDKVDAMYRVPSWREPLEPVAFGTFDRKYRIHCDPATTGANFSLAIGHLEDAPPDEHGIVWPHVVFDLLKVWRPMDFPEDPETKKRTIDYIQVHNDIEDILGRFMSTERISFDQWNSASFIASLKQKFMPDIRVSEVTFTDKENQARCEKFKSALNLGWVHAYVDNFYRDDLSCLLELELKFLSEKNGKVVKQETGPVTTKDLADSVMVVTVDLLHHALDRWSSSRMTAGAFGSSDAAALKSGRENDRANLVGVERRFEGKVGQKVDDIRITKIANQRRGKYEADRLSSIHSRQTRQRQERPRRSL